MAAVEEHLIECINVLTIRDLVRLQERQREHVQEIRTILDSPQTVGIGLGQHQEEEQSCSELAITFYVFNKSTEASLRLRELVRQALSLELRDPVAIPVDVVELGELSSQHLLQTSTAASVENALAVSGAWFPPTVQPGYAIKHCNGPLGTFGAVVKDSAGQPFALSNCHILALDGAASLGDQIDYPGLPGPLGKLHRFIPLQDGGRFSNLADAAIASFSERARSRLDPRLRTLGTLPAGEIDPSRGMAVIKIGLDGKQTESRIVDVNFRAVFPSGAHSFGFLDQILCCPRFGGDGDSGALVLEKGTRRAVGLNFAGTADLGGSVCCPIGRTLEALEVALLSE
jgi:hypothetical protein